MQQEPEAQRSNMNPKNLKPIMRITRDAPRKSIGVMRLFNMSIKREMSYARLAELLRNEWRGSLVVLDTSFFARHEIDTSVWEALLENAMLIPRYVWRELAIWRDHPFANKDAAKLFRDAEQSRNPAIILDEHVGWSQAYKYGRAFYNSLLGFRKTVSRWIVADFESRHGRTPTRQELNDLFTARGTARDFHLLRKGYDDYGGHNFYADEDALVTAAMAALHRGRKTIVITRDGDLLDQFHKFWGLLGYHYQALLFSDIFAATPDTFRTRPLPQDRGAVDQYFLAANGFLVKKPVSDPAEFSRFVLPVNYQSVPIACMLLGGQPPDMTASIMSFAAERDMRRVILAKGVTRGRSTVREDGLNCHVTGLPCGIEDSRHWVAFVQDRVMICQNSPLQFPLLDRTHAVSHQEDIRTASLPPH
jgi:hypothetical protein